jgi:hypothetical protein
VRDEISLIFSRAALLKGRTRMGSECKKTIHCFNNNLISWPDDDECFFELFVYELRISSLYNQPAKKQFFLFVTEFFVGTTGGNWPRTSC